MENQQQYDHSFKVHKVAFLLTRPFPFRAVLNEYLLIIVHHFGSSGGWSRHLWGRLYETLYMCLTSVSIYHQLHGTTLHFTFIYVAEFNARVSSLLSKCLRICLDLCSK